MTSWIFIGVLVAAALFGVMIYNRLVALKQNRKNAFADIDVQLKMRHDLIPNLAEVVRKYAAHEKGVLENVTAARAQAMQAHSVNDKISAEKSLDGSLMKLMAVAENYPQLKADSTFNNFSDQLSDIEKTIAAARRFFNNATAELNAAIAQFPAVLIAPMLGFREEPFFDLGDARSEFDKPVAVTL